MPQIESQKGIMGQIDPLVITNVSNVAKMDSR